MHRAPPPPPAAVVVSQGLCKGTLALLSNAPRERVVMLATQICQTEAIKLFLWV